MLLLAARLENSIPNDPKYVAALIHLPARVVSAALVDLIDKGFLEVSRPHDASEPLANVYARDRDREEAQELLETEKASVEKSVENAPKGGELIDLNVHVL
jgi:hypothetical protein